MINIYDLKLRDIMTVQDTEQALNIKSARVCKLCQDGRFNGAVKFGGIWLIPAESVQEFKRRRRGPKAGFKHDNAHFIKQLFANNEVVIGTRSNTFTDTQPQFPEGASTSCENVCLSESATTSASGGV